MESGENKRGIKRKREFQREEDVTVKLGHRLHHGLKEVKKASKKAKIFETQKLVKRLKDLRKNEKEEDMKAVESQLATLKHVDHERIAMTALKSKLKKDHLLSSNLIMQAAISKEMTSAMAQVLVNSGSHQAIIESRMLSSKVLAQEITAVVQALRSLLGDKSGDAEKKSQDAEKNSLDHIGRVQKGNKNSGVDGLKTHNQPDVGEYLKAAGGMRPVGGGDSTEEQVGADGDGWESDSLDINPDNEVHEEEDGWESGSVEDQEVETKHAGDDGDITGEDSSEEPESEASIAHGGLAKKGKTLKSNRDTKPGESEFLPSLSVGFTRGDSDASDWSENEVDVVDGALKKNRRGQRARKAIWEKKYGKNANHIKKQREENVSALRGSIRGRGSGTGRGMIRGGKVASTHTSSYDRQTMSRRGTGGDAGNRGRALSQTGSNAISLVERPQRKTLEEKPLHPSWEAKRKLKEKQSAGIVPSQGIITKFM